jgi:4-amino-4-deoxy-L-arabinose transferase-like glycosyltransferase
VLKYKYLFAVLIITAAFTGILGHSLWQHDEPRVAEVGREFLDKGNSLSLPLLNKEPFLEQPPLYYWTLALSYTVFGGPGSVTARLPSVLFGLLTILATFIFVKKVYGSETAIRAAVVLSLLYVFFFIAHLCIVDSSLVFFVTLSVYLLHTAINSEGKKKLFYYLLYYVAATGAVFSKGFIGLAFSVVLFLFWVVWTRDWKEIVKAQPWLGIVIVGSLVGIWIYFLGTKGSWKYVETWLIHNNISRFIPFLGKIMPSVETYQGGHTKWLFSYFGGFWGAFAPWSILGPAVFVWAWKTRREDKNSAFLLLWFACGFILLSVAGTKRNLYLAPLSAPFAILTAKYLEELESGKIADMFSRISQIILVTISALLPLALIGWAVWTKMPFTLSFVLLLSVLSLADVIVLRSFLREWRIKLLPISIYFFLCFAVLFHIFLPYTNEEVTTRLLYADIKKVLAERNLPFYAYCPSENSRGSVAFYTGHFMIPLRNFPSAYEVSKKEKESLILVVDRTKEKSIFEQIYPLFPTIVYKNVSDKGERHLWILSNKRQ